MTVRIAKCIDGGWWRRAAQEPRGGVGSTGGASQADSFGLVMSDVDNSDRIVDRVRILDGVNAIHKCDSRSA